MLFLSKDSKLLPSPSFWNGVLNEVMSFQTATVTIILKWRSKWSNEPSNWAATWNRRACCFVIVEKSFERIWSHLLKKSLLENFTFCATGEISLKTTGAFSLVLQWIQYFLLNWDWPVSLLIYRCLPKNECTYALVRV